MTVIQMPLAAKTSGQPAVLHFNLEIFIRFNWLQGVQRVNNSFMLGKQKQCGRKGPRGDYKKLNKKIIFLLSSSKNKFHRPIREVGLLGIAAHNFNRTRQGKM